MTYEEYLSAGEELNRQLGNALPPFELLPREEWERYNTQETENGKG